MSTTFGIKVPLFDDYERVIHRHNIGNGEVAYDILNPLVLLLPDETELIALDNSNQGINTIGDFKNVLYKDYI